MAVITPRQASLELLDRKRAASNLIDFTLYRRPDFQVAPHHRTIAGQLERVESGEVNRLIITCPPRHTKSELASRSFPAWYIGKHPTNQIISATYSTEIARDFGRDVRNIVADPGFTSVFPGIWLRPDSTSSSRWHTNKGGIYVSASVNGPLTSKGAHVALIDDPHKNYQEAQSLKKTGAVWKWYRSVLYSRLMPGGAIVIIMQRMSTHDLVARVLAAAPRTGDKWEVVNLPALDTSEVKPDAEGRVDLAKGKALWPGWYPVERLLAIRANQTDEDEDGELVTGAMTFDMFDAMYQQDPKKAGGVIVKREHLRYWSHPDYPATHGQGRPMLPKVMSDHTQSWDLAFKGDTLQQVTKTARSFVVGQYWACDGPHEFLLDQVRGKWEFGQCCDEMVAFSIRHPQARMKLVEDKANGPAIESQLRNKVSGIKLIPPLGDKAARMRATQPEFESHHIFLPPPELYPWVGELVTRLLAFPSEPNDEGDCLSQFINWRSTSPGILSWMREQAEKVKAEREAAKKGTPTPGGRP